MRAANFYQYVDSVAGRFPTLGQSAITRSLRGGIRLDKVQNHLQRIYLNQIYNVGVLAQLSELADSPSRNVLVRRGDKENYYDRGRITDLALANARLLTALNQLGTTDSIDVDYNYSVGRQFILPNLTVNTVEYQRRLDEELNQLSNVKEVINTGDVIVFARSKVTQAQEDALQEMVKVMRREAAGHGWLVALLPLLARILMVVAGFVALYLFFYYFRPEIFRSNPKLLALFMIFALQMVLIYLAELLNLESIYIYPLAVLPVMVTILFDAEVGILSTIVLALLLGVMHRFSFSLVLLTAVVGIVGCLTSRQIGKRSHFYRTMFAVILAYILLILVVENLKLSADTEILTAMGYGLMIGVFSILVIMGILPVFESLFGVITDTTLLELSDLNHPLLKRLSIEAPGTYHHSISVGNLSEAAAEAIGANPLLARVGAYYHDIGKIEIPEYFVENQFSVRSKHDSLTPTMSALILSSHVKKGRLLGEEADIPDVVLNFIEEHHGSMVMSYFYNKSKEQGGDEGDMDKFRYPGPKPQTRETGIAMLADAVEAASRTLEDPKPARIDSLIQRIINDRFQSGELDQCPLTLRDLAKIKVAFAQVLIAVFHHRVRYPAGQQA
jgi:putative nucleotidyltransferase with HDIG domain